MALWRAVGLTRPWNDPGADFDRALASGSSTVILACAGEDLLGTAMVGDDGHRGWIYYLGVREERRGAGIARVLMEQCEAWLIARGCPRVRLMVRGDNAAALGFYAAIGYDAQDVVTLGRNLRG